MKGMIFAAGLGTRLRPLTDTIPKALIEVGGVPMLGRVLRKMADAGVSDIVVNVHHHADKVAGYLATAPVPGVRTAVSDESSLLLDTGGGVARAAALLDGDDPVVLHNADILTDFPLREMMEAHMASGADVTLLADSRQTSRYLLFDGEGRMRGWMNALTGEVRPPHAGVNPDTLRRLAFGGVHIISPRVVRMLAGYSRDCPKFSITPFYTDRCAELDIRAFTPAEPYRWFDIGRPETLAEAIKTFV